MFRPLVLIAFCSSKVEAEAGTDLGSKGARGQCTMD
jgi:hypothetical protein